MSGAALKRVSFAPGEQILAELIPTRRSVLFPVLELLVITGLVWMGIGAIDRFFDVLAVRVTGDVIRPATLTPASLNNPVALGALWARRGLLVLWVVLAWRRCIRHLLFRRRSRLVLTTHRLVTATGHVRSRLTEVPLPAVVDARRRGSSVSVYVEGSRQPLVLKHVPQSKRFTQLLQQHAGVHRWGSLR